MVDSYGMYPDDEKAFDLALTRNYEADDTVVPIYDGLQWIGGIEVHKRRLEESAKERLDDDVPDSSQK